MDQKSLKTKWYQAEGTPEKNRKISQGAGIIMGLVCFLIAYLIWKDGNTVDSKYLAFWGISMLVFFTIIPYIGLHKRYVAFMQRKAKEIKSKK